MGASALFVSHLWPPMHLRADRVCGVFAARAHGVPAVQEVLLITCGDRFRRPRLLSAASQALLKFCADEERQMRDFLSSGGCKGLYTPHVCTLDPQRISMPRFFTVRPPPQFQMRQEALSPPQALCRCRLAG